MCTYTNKVDALHSYPLSSARFQNDLSDLEGIVSISRISLIIRQSCNYNQNKRHACWRKAIFRCLQISCHHSPFPTAIRKLSGTESHAHPNHHIITSLPLIPDRVSTPGCLLILNRNLLASTILVFSADEITDLLILRLFDSRLVVLGSLAHDVFLDEVDSCLGK